MPQKQLPSKAAEANQPKERPSLVGVSAIANLSEGDKTIKAEMLAAGAISAVTRACNAIANRLSYQRQSKYRHACQTDHRC